MIANNEFCAYYTTSRRQQLSELYYSQLIAVISQLVDRLQLNRQTVAV